jgi:hypothetical protein
MTAITSEDIEFGKWGDMKKKETVLKAVEQNG